MFFPLESGEQRAIFPLKPISRVPRAPCPAAFPRPPRRPAAPLRFPLCTPLYSCTRTSGLTLPEGFCAVLVGSDLGAVRHITVAPNGDIFAAVEEGKGVLALRDTNGDGVADVRKTFGPGGGSGIALRGDNLYFATDTRVVRWRLPPGELEPPGEPETDRGRVAHRGPPRQDPRAAGRGYPDRQPRLGHQQLPGARPGELGRRDTIPVPSWRPGPDCGASALHAPGRVRGTESAMPPASAMRWRRRSTGAATCIAAPHGRDQLGANWGFSDAQNAELPAEEFMQVKAGDDFGWPYCYYDWQQAKKVLAPEYGGDGKAIGRCSTQERPADRLPRPLGAYGDRVLLREPVPGFLPGGRVHRVSRLVESRSVAPAGIPGRLRAVRFWPSHGPVHYFRDEQQGSDRPSRCGGRGRPRWLALHLGGQQREDLAGGGGEVGRLQFTGEHPWLIEYLA